MSSGSLTAETAGSILDVMRVLVQMGLGVTTLLRDALSRADNFGDSVEELKALAVRSQNVQRDFFAFKDALLSNQPVFLSDLEKIKNEMQEILDSTLIIINPPTQVSEQINK
jgi:hypothetical protein